MQALHLLLGWKGITGLYKRGEIGPAGGAGSIFFRVFLFPRAMSQVPCLHENLANAARVNTPLLCSAANLMPRCLQRGC